MDETKRSTLHELSIKYLSVNKTVMSDINENSDSSDLIEKKAVLELLDNMYLKAESMPVWPFNIKTLVSFITITFIPLALLLLEVILQEILASLLNIFK